MGRQGGLPILVVDDDDSTRRYLSALLSPLGHQVALADSAEDALGRLGRGFAPGLVLLDLILPGMDGLEALGRIKEIQPRTPVIILSTVGQIKTAVEAMRRGASDYLAKPFQQEELELAIEQALETQRLRDEVRDLRRRLDEEPEDSPTANPRRVQPAGRAAAGAGGRPGDGLDQPAAGQGGGRRQLPRRRPFRFTRPWPAAARPGRRSGRHPARPAPTRGASGWPARAGSGS